MIFWVFAIAITAATCYAIARPFLNKQQGDTPLNTAAYDVAVFKSQLQEVERDLARNRITLEEAEASRLEIGRRLLIADKRQSELETERKRAGTSRAAQAIGGTVIIAAVVVSVLLYGRMGDPRNPDMPLVLRQAELQLAQGGNQTQPDAANDEAGTLDSMASQLRPRLQAGQGGSDDWALLGRTEMMRGDFEAAASAYTEALKDNPDDPDLNSAYGEALVFWANGDVTDTAATVFHKVLSTQPDDVRAHQRMRPGLRLCENGPRHWRMKWVSIFPANWHNCLPWHPPPWDLWRMQSANHPAPAPMISPPPNKWHPTSARI